MIPMIQDVPGQTLRNVSLNCFGDHSLFLDGRKAADTLVIREGFVVSRNQAFHLRLP
jgi:hypothetical protein